MEIERIVERFRMAAFGMGDWADALALFAQATDATVVHLAGVGRHGSLHCNLLSGATPDMLSEYLAEGGLDPARNPRTRVALAGISSRCVVDDLMDARTRGQLPIYFGLFRRSDSEHAATMRLATPRLSASLTAMRGRSAGAFAQHECRTIEALAPAVSEIVAQAVQLGTAQDDAVVDGVEASGSAVLLLDRGGRVVSASRHGQQLLAADGPFALRTGRVVARDPRCAAAFEQAMAGVSDPAGTLQGLRRVLVRRADGMPMAVEVSALPQRPSGPLSRARVMVTWRAPPSISGAVLADAYMLTRAETAVAVLLAEGHDLAAIAAQRGCSLATIRSQVKSLFGKTDTRRQGELVARLRAIG